MPDHQTVNSPIRPRAFTMAELLVVIGIILLLISILIPTVSKVREAGQATDTKALISAIDGACQVYYQDHRKWPGPLSEAQVAQNAADTGITVRASAEYAGNGDDLSLVTGTENLVLGLLGGLVIDSDEIVYDPALVGNGAVSLGNQPGGYNAYFDARPQDLSMTDDAGVKTGAYSDDSAAAQDSIIPEFIDRFSNAMPLLYLRAQPIGFTETFTSDVVSDVFEYNAIAGYVGNVGGTPPAYIGVGKEPDDTYYADGTPLGADTTPAVPPQFHGLVQQGHLDGADLADLRSSMDKSADNYTYPFDLRAALVSPSAAEARQKDRYVIISAGVDRIYGTRDDLTNFGGY